MSLKSFFLLSLFFLTSCATSITGSYTEYKNSKFIVELKSKADELVELQTRLFDVETILSQNHPSIVSIKTQTKNIQESIPPKDKDIFLNLYTISLAEKIVYLEVMFSSIKDPQQQDHLQKMIKKLYKLIPPNNKDAFYKIKKQIIDEQAYTK